MYESLLDKVPNSKFKKKQEECQFLTERWGLLAKGVRLFPKKGAAPLAVLSFLSLSLSFFFQKNKK